MRRLEVILLQNTVIRHSRFSAGSRVVVDEEIGRYLIEHALACVVTDEGTETVIEKKTRRRTNVSS